MTELSFTAASEVVAEVRADGVAVVRLCRPEALNALTPNMVRGLSAAVEELAAHPSIAALVLVGEGRAFCAGADIHFEQAAGERDFAAFVEDLQQLTRVLRSSRLLVVAAVNGIAVGGGFELALACDHRAAAPGAMLGFPEVTLGLTVTSGVTHMLPRILGTSRAIELLLSGRSMVAAEALEAGLVDAVDDDALAAAVRLAAVAAAAPPGLVELIKAGVYGGADSTLEQALGAEARAIGEAFRRPGAREALREFVERRPRKVRG
jgi:enoyl-CoA hydratase/carnithine racemase